MDGVKDVRMQVMVGRDDQAPNFAMRHFVVAPGGHTPHHSHDYEHEVYIVAGTGQAECDGETATVSEGDVLYVHGSPRDPTREYVFKQDIRDRSKMDEIFVSPPELSWKVCFAGHTHHPGVFVQSMPYLFLDPNQIEMRYEYSTRPERVMVNVGSVGQPRDGDSRASYVIIDDTAIHFRRVDYDLERTLRRFEENPGLPEYLAERLKEGK